MTTSFHTFFRLAVSATEPIVASFMAMGTMAVTCCQSTWAGHCSAGAVCEWRPAG
jgi:hypothetical protein